MDDDNRFGAISREPDEALTINVADIHIHLHTDGQAPGVLDSILAKLSSIERIVMADSQQLTDLAAQVAANTTVIGSAEALISGFADQLAAAGTDPAKLQALHDSLAADDAGLAAAVAANTPAAPPAPAPVA